MQHMQDKEFDQLFKDKFEGAEMEPPAGLWNNIEQGITPQKKRRLPLYWMAAAAVIAIVTAGLIFLNQPERIQLQSTATVAEKPTVGSGAVVKNDSVAVNKNAGKQDIGALQNGSVVDAQVAKVQEGKKGIDVQTISAQTSSVLMAASKKIDRVKDNKAENQEINDELKKDLQVMQPFEQVAHLNNKPAAVKQNVIVNKKYVAPVETRLVNEKGLAKEGTMIASTETPVITPDEVVNDNEQSEKKGIRNVGDLINYVVDKVDKREDKILKFKTDDDDNSSLIGINIGMIKFNKKHK